MKLIAFCTSFLLICSFSVSGQQSMLPPDEEQQVNVIITELFDGYRVGDSTRVRSTFTINATFQSAYYNKEGESILSKPKSIDAFVSYIGVGLDKVHDEQLWNTSIKIDKNLASVWTNYAFYLDGEFSHCGSENFLLIKNDGHWKIFHLVDTRQKIGCEIPDSLQYR
ncbi:MAG: hypothetical protein L3J29_12810 [Cyclobacteriaceae bacterium]|nr:hypothetical protein [Cyclobacteriaceae bacterium]